MYTEDVDKVFNQAISSGATMIMPATNSSGAIDMDN
jgi:uncharacterized glyoxalase superfamily protein PhnB